MCFSCVYLIKFIIFVRWIQRKIQGLSYPLDDDWSVKHIEYTDTFPVSAKHLRCLCLFDIFIHLVMCAD